MALDEGYPLALPKGTILGGQYVIEQVLGQGGFGITYKATDHKTGQSVAVKEFFPDSLATRTTATTVSAFSGARSESFAYGKGCFLQEAETLAQFIGNEHIVRVFSYFEENGTAYFVMEFIEGTSFDRYIKDHGGKLPYEEAERILLPVIDALAAVHAKGIVHRDVTPDNIYITKDGTVKLLDFGAARYSLGDKSRSLDVVLKHGFAPKEQYTRHGKQGPFTDVYTLGASFYFAITGKRPPDSIDRIDEDELVPPSSLVRIAPEKEDAILKAMSVQPSNRYQTMVDFREALMSVPEEEALAAAVVAPQAVHFAPQGAVPQGTEAQPQSALQKEASLQPQGGVQAGTQDGVPDAEVVKSEAASAESASVHRGDEQDKAEAREGTKKKSVWATVLLTWKSFTPKRKAMCACGALALVLVVVSATVIGSHSGTRHEDGSIAATGSGNVTGKLGGAWGNILESLAELSHEHVWIKIGGGEASCEGNGSIDWSCSCGETRTEEVPPTGHSWKETGKVEPNCEDGGSIDYICSSCNETYTEEVPPTGHRWSETGSVTASCEKDGSISYACESCGVTYTEEVPPTGHDWSETGSVAATCDKDGSVSYACESCGKTRKEKQEKLGHDWSETGSVAATCDKKGSISYVCSICSKTRSETVAALGHNWSETGRTAACCEKSGSVSYACSSCGATRSEAVSATGHSWYETGRVAACCEQNGSVNYACSNCGTTRSEVLAALGHNFNVLIVDRPPQCDEPGYRHYHCSGCGICSPEYETEHYGSPLGHVDADNDGRCDRCSGWMR